MNNKKLKKQLTITVKGNSFGNQYAREGQKEYYSKWKITLTQNKNGGISEKIELISYNLDTPKDVEKEHKKLEEYQRLCNFGL
jgi:hypothetical protein